MEKPCVGVLSVDSGKICDMSGDRSVELGDDVGVEGFPTIKFGDPANLEDPSWQNKHIMHEDALCHVHLLKGLKVSKPSPFTIFL